MVDLLGRGTVNGTVMDISASGLRATLPSAMFVGDTRLLRVLEPSGGEQMRWGEVVWSRQTPTGFQVGLRFCHRPQASLTR
jgi:PilZ domain